MRRRWIGTAARRGPQRNGTPPSPGRGREGRDRGPRCHTADGGWIDSRLWQGRSALLTIVVAGLVAGLATPAAAGPAQLRLVDLGSLNGVCCSQATALNDRGDVVGESNVGTAMSARHAFRWRDGRMVDLGTLGGTNSTATDVNSHGDIVGASDLVGGSTHAVLWREGHMVDLGTLGGDASYATAINDAGEVVGFSGTAPGTFELHAFSWRDGVMTDLGTLAGGNARATDVNNRGQVVGTSSVDGMNTVPVRWQRGTPRSLSARDGQASAINDRGQVTGFFFAGGGAFLWSAGRIRDLGTLPGASFVQTLGINNRGDVVGYTDVDAFLWQHGRMTALARLAGSTTSAYDINNRGQIVGLSASSPDGTDYHAVLWTR